MLPSAASPSSQALARCTNSEGTADVFWSSIQFLFPDHPGKRQWCPCTLWAVSPSVCLTSLSRTLYKCSLPPSTESVKGREAPLQVTKPNRRICLARLGKYSFQVATGLKRVPERRAGPQPWLLKPRREHFHTRSENWEESLRLGGRACPRVVPQGGICAMSSEPGGTYLPPTASWWACPSMFLLSTGYPRGKNTR